MSFAIGAGIPKFPYSLNPVSQGLGLEKVYSVGVIRMQLQIDITSCLSEVGKLPVYPFIQSTFCIGAIIYRLS